MKVKILYTFFLSLFLLQTACGGGGGSGKKSSEEAPSEEPVSAPVEAPLEAPQPVSYLLISSGDLNHAGITMYNLDGSVNQSITDLRDFGSAPNGLAPGSNNGASDFITSVNGSDALLQVPYSSNFDIFYGSSNLNGNVYDIEHNSILDYYYVIESNNIEVFSAAGERLSSAIIPQNLGACSMSNPRGLYLSDDGFLYVASYSNNRILKYNVTNHFATCEASYDVPGLNPAAVLRHSNGLLYIASFADDAVFTLNEDDLTLTNIFDPGLAILRDPTAFVELPDASLLVSSSTTDSIERIDASGARQGVEPFIRDIYSLNILDMEIVVR